MGGSPFFGMLRHSSRLISVVPSVFEKFACYLRPYSDIGRPQLTTEIGDLLLKSRNVGTDDFVPTNKPVTLKTAKGTRDYDPKQMTLRTSVIEKIVKVFKRHGASNMDTPVFELKEILYGKYGEDTKLIYDLGYQGGELLSLRYDLTVPFARYLAMNKITNFKRYQIAKVYRRDNPVMTKGRYREFYQCDFDIAGVYEPLVTDVECVRVLSEIFQALGLTIRIKVNHRAILDGMLLACGIDPIHFKTICSSIDKLDKSPWETVRTELVTDKGLSEVAADMIGSYVDKSGSVQLVVKMLKLGNPQGFDLGEKNLTARKGLEQLLLFFKYCDTYKIGHLVTFDMSLARGLDYYTGMIFEAVLVGEGSDCGSIAGGGRYDNLVETLDPKLKMVPCVGISIGMERVFSVVEANMAREKKKIRSTDVQVYIASAQKDFLVQRMILCREIWDADIKAEFSYKRDPKLLAQLQYCEEEGIPFALIIGEAELRDGVVILRDVKTRIEKRVSRPEIGKLMQKEIKLLEDKPGPLDD